MRTDILDWTPETQTLLAADGKEAMIAVQAVEKSLKELTVLVDKISGLALAMGMRVVMYEGRVEELSKRTDALTKLIPLLEEWKAKQ